MKYLMNAKVENYPNGKYKVMEVNNVGKITMEQGDTVWILRHVYTGAIGIEISGIDGVFYDLAIARKAKALCEHDKPNWNFYLDDYRIITNIYE